MQMKARVPVCTYCLCVGAAVMFLDLFELLKKNLTCKIYFINLGCDLGSSLKTASKYVPIYFAFCIRYPARQLFLVWCGMIVFQSFDGVSLVSCLWNLHPAAKPAASISFLLVLSSHNGLNVAQFNLNWTWNEFQGDMNTCFTLIYKWNKSSTRLLH